MPGEAAGLTQDQVQLTHITPKLNAGELQERKGDGASVTMTANSPVGVSELKTLFSSRRS